MVSDLAEYIRRWQATQVTIHHVSHVRPCADLWYHGFLDPSTAIIGHFLEGMHAGDAHSGSMGFLAR
jgi:hypothetical protein